MRIISGEHKGRRYSGQIPNGIRPTTDIVRESLFNILNNYTDYKNLTVADICAGTGFMGFEAISRGAERCYFFEKNLKHTELIKKIAAQFKIDNYKIITGDALKKLKSFSLDNPDVKFDLIFFDAPYNSNLFAPIIDIIDETKLLAKGGFMLIEHPNTTQLIIPETFKIITERIFGTTKVLIIQN